MSLLRIRNPLYRDVVRLIVSLSALLVTVWFFIQQVVAPEFYGGSILFNLYTQGILVFGSSSSLIAGLVGFWGGIVALWTIDNYKRFLAIVPLSVGGLFYVAAGMPSLNLPAIDSIAALLLIFLFTIQLGGIRILQRILGNQVSSNKSTTLTELRRGPRAFFILVCVLVLIGIFDNHVTVASNNIDFHATGLFWSGVLGSAIIWLSFQFIKYDKQQRVVQIGPGRSGKTSIIGGLYCDIDDRSHIDDRNKSPGEDRSGNLHRRPIENEHLINISQDLREVREFPDKTENNGRVGFNYYNSMRIFRRKNEIVTFDYRGQILTGTENQDSNSDGNDDVEHRSLSERLRDHRRSGKRLRRIKNSLRRISGNGSPWFGDKNPNIEEILEHSDTVVFTLPLDDYLTPLFDRGVLLDKEVELPDYADVYLVKHVPDASDEEIYEVCRPGGESFRIKRNPDGDLEREDHENIPEGLNFDSFESLPLAKESNTDDAPDRRYCHGRKRVPPAEYLNEYDNLLDRLSEKRTGVINRPRDFIWVTTMSDLVYEDFENVYKRTVSRLDNNDTERYRNFQKCGLFTDKEPKRRKQADYALFGQWILNECIGDHLASLRDTATKKSSGHPDIQRLVTESGEQHIYPVWFNVKRDGDTLGIVKDDLRLLKGSEYLFDRLEGYPLRDWTYVNLEKSPLKVAYERNLEFEGRNPLSALDRALNELQISANSESESEDQSNR